MIKTRLLEARLNKGFSQEKLADLIGTSQPNYSRREKGIKKITDIEWTKIAKELGVQKEAIYETDQQTTIHTKTKDNDSRNRLLFTTLNYLLEHIAILNEQNKALNEKLKKFEV